MTILSTPSHLTQAKTLLSDNQVTPARVGWKVSDCRVVWNTGLEKYRCTCGSRIPPDTPRPKICAHILAVILYRKANPAPADEVGAAPDCGIRSPQPVLSIGVDEPPPLHPLDNPTPSDTLFIQHDSRPLPDWVQDIRPHQWDATEEIIEGFKSGKRVMWLDAPTGSGKTLIGDMVRRIKGDPALYVCSGKTLQDQFVADFDYANVLKGKRNYPTQTGNFPTITCDDCTRVSPDDDCTFCPDPTSCAYPRAKQRALRGRLAVINTSYLFAEANGPGAFSGRGLGILDECDVLEQELMSFVEFNLTHKAIQNLKLTPPGKGVHYRTIMKWVVEELEPAAKLRLKELGAQGELFKGDVRKVRSVKAAGNLVSNINRVISMSGIESEEGLTSENWVRDNKGGPLVLKPVTVSGYGEDVLWRHAKNWLCMSATIISPEMLSESLGLGGDDWGVVRVPMTFPVENRPIYQVPVANMVNKEKDTAWPEMVDGIKRVLRRHEGERVLVHTVSYALADFLVGELKRGNSEREIITYKSGEERERAIARYRGTPGAVIVAPSLDRGVDFKDDDCRVVILAKMPYPYLGDPQVSKRMNGKNGNMWYAVQTVRSIVQMTGRGMRHKGDRCATYVLDAQFGSNVYKRNKRLFPKWWQESVEFMRKGDL